MNYYIKTTDEQAMWSALENAGLAKKDFDPDDPLNQAPEMEMEEDWQPTGAFTWSKSSEYDLDIIGIIYKPTGKMLQSENGEYFEMTPVDGFHANIRGITKEKAAMLSTIKKPDNPVRVWLDH